MQRRRVADLLFTLRQSCKCPGHSRPGQFSALPNALPSKDYAFEMVSSTLRYGVGVTREVGHDILNLGAKKVCIVTDKTLVNMQPVKTTAESLARAGVKFDIYDSTRVEPTDER